MTREQHLAYCQVCSLRSFSAQDGIICSLTSRTADFEETCATYTPEVTTTQNTAAVNERKAYVKLQTAMASGGQRFANLIIDTIIYYILIFAFGFGMAIIIGIISPETFSDVDTESAGFTVLSYLFALSVRVVYYTFMEGVFGRTVGKFITGTCVIDKNGKTPEPDVAFVRSLFRCVPFEAFSFLGNPARGWHDAWTDTWVIEKKYQGESED